MGGIDHDPIRPPASLELIADCGLIFSDQHFSCHINSATEDQCAPDKMDPPDLEGALGRDLRYATAPSASKFAPGKFVNHRPTGYESVALTLRLRRPATSPLSGKRRSQAARGANCPLDIPLCQGNRVLSPFSQRAIVSGVTHRIMHR